MVRTTVVFVHGFTGDASSWDSFVARLEKDEELVSQGYSFCRFQYPTKFLELNPLRRIPRIDECGNSLAGFLDNKRGFDQLFLVGHSMGGLVIQSYLAEKITAQRGTDLGNIRSVILFATPNRGSNTLQNLRELLSQFNENPQEAYLRVLNRDVAKVDRIIVRSILGAARVTRGSCPIPFRVFWGLEDNVVQEDSARGSFAEATGLPGDHKEIIQCNPKDPADPRYQALKDALLNPVGHPSIYEMDLLDVSLSVSPVAPETTYTLRGDVEPLSIKTDNKAVLASRMEFSRQNRCKGRYKKTCRSEHGLVELISLTEPNEASPSDKSAYRKDGKKFYYEFTPDQGDTFSIKLLFYNGFGDRQWHMHLKPNVRYKLCRFTLNLKDYQDAGYEISQGSQMYLLPNGTMDHDIPKAREDSKPIEPLQSKDPWLQSWEICDISNGGMVDIAWHLKT